ncbi:MAG: hypothetical protein HDT38_05660 [Clostridiales bacterium]|nr:hypothetical protein [Clostridiales bacterium]
MKRKSTSLARAILPLLLCVLFLIPTAYADLGPKPELTITVVNAPEGELYLDLLTRGKPTEYPYPNHVEERDPVILENLRSLEGDGWVLAYSTGASGSPPVFGDLRPQEDGTWRFSYVGLPETFRVAAATADEAKVAESAYTRQFVSHIVYDWEANTVRDATPPVLRFFVRLASTLIPTLMIEGLVFWLFGFREKHSWLVFVVVNIITQTGLHLAVGATLTMSGWHFLNYFLLMIIPEAIIWAVEAALYAALLQEHGRRRRVGYALLANLASFAAGFVPLHLLYDFLKSL